MKTLPSSTAAFSLVEVAIALCVAVFALIAIFGMLLVGIKGNQASINQTAATGILSAVAADLRATRHQTFTETTAVASTRFSIPVPATPVVSGTSKQFFLASNGKLADASYPANYVVTVNFLPPNPGITGTITKTAIVAQLQVSWPAAVSIAKATGCVQTFIALDRN